MKRINLRNFRTSTVAPAKGMLVAISANPKVRLADRNRTVLAGELAPECAGRGWREHYERQLARLENDGQLGSILAGLPNGSVFVGGKHRHVLARFLSERCYAQVRELQA